MRFEKRALAVTEQIDLLKSRGMVIKDLQYAQQILQFISFFRLKAYWLPFEVPSEGNGARSFQERTTFEDVLAFYFFDRNLRLLVLNAIEIVEVAFRAQWVNHIALRHGPRGFLELNNYKTNKEELKAKSIENFKNLEKECERSRAPFIVHYNKKYTYPKELPIWLAAEIISLGLLSRFYQGLKNPKDRQVIAKSFGLDEKVFTSFAHHISHVRNICAHHGRLWNWRFKFRMRVPNKPSNLSKVMRTTDSDRLYNTLIMLDYLLNIITPGNNWKDQVVELIDKFSALDPAKEMGFPSQWRTSSTWQIQ